MNRRILLYVAMTFLFLGLVGCGKKQDESSTNTQPIIQDEVQVNNTQIDSESVDSEVATPVVDAEGYTVTDDYVKTTSMTVNVRVSPSTDAAIYRMLEEGTVLNRTGYKGDWTRILMDGTDFYVHSEFLVKTEKPEELEEPPEDVAQQDVNMPEDTETPKVKKVVIDPGNQANANAAQEPIGPNSDVTKQGISVGKVGVLYGTKEYELNLAYAQLLKAELESRGYEVLLTRDNNAVDMTNKQRAEFANQSEATVFIRIQMNYSSNDDLSGVMALCMAENSPYNSQLYSESYALSTRLLQGIIEETGAVNNGIYETNEMTAINWSQIPVAVVKIGFLSNAEEEANLVSDEYKNKVITGIANGIDYYFEQ